ncbi:MAG: galactose-1-phosphate uridylyltransferase [Deinococcales bacterium]
MSLGAIEKVISLWQREYESLGQRYKWVQIFENKGEIMGCSNPHPHGQIWASDHLPTLVALEDQSQPAYYLKKTQSLLLDYARAELDKDERIIMKNDHWLAVVPY